MHPAVVVHVGRCSSWPLLQAMVAKRVPPSYYHLHNHLVLEALTGASSSEVVQGAGMVRCSSQPLLQVAEKPLLLLGAGRVVVVQVVQLPRAVVNHLV